MNSPNTESVMLGPGGWNRSTGEDWSCFYSTKQTHKNKTLFILLGKRVGGIRQKDMNLLSSNRNEWFLAHLFYFMTLYYIIKYEKLNLPWGEKSTTSLYLLEIEA